MRIFLIFLAFFIVGVLIALLINYIFKKRRYVKYLIGLAILGFGAYQIIYARVTGGGFEALGIAIMGIFLGFMGIVIILSSAVIDSLKKYKKR